MIKTITLLDTLKAAYSLTSDYQLAKKLGVKTATVSRYRNGLSFLDDRTAFEVSELLELEPSFVVACANLERAERQNDQDSINFWKQYASIKKNATGWRGEERRQTRGITGLQLTTAI